VNLISSKTTPTQENQPDRTDAEISYAFDSFASKAFWPVQSGKLQHLFLRLSLVVEREGRLTGYLSAATFWIANHGVAETEENMKALILGAAARSSEPVSFLFPTRQAGLFRWCLSEGMKAVKPMVLMARGQYQEPKGSYFPSVFY
jgi:hypothetical protein